MTSNVEVERMLEKARFDRIAKANEPLYVNIFNALGAGLWLTVGGSIAIVIVGAIIALIAGLIVIAFMKYPIPSSLFSLTWFVVSVWIYWDERREVSGPLRGVRVPLKCSGARPEKNGNNGESQ